MMKRKKVNLVLLEYSDSEHEGDDENMDEEYDEDDNQSMDFNDEQNNLNDGQNQHKNEVAQELYFEDVFGDGEMSILEFHQSLLNKNVDEIIIPPVTKMKCSEELQNQIETLYEKVQNGYDLNKAIQKRKSLRNPSIYEKMISYCQINEMHTNYPKEIYNPEPFLKNDSYYEELSKAQKDEMERREREKKETEKNNQNKKKNDLVRERKSKWDSTTENRSAAIVAALAVAKRDKHLTNPQETTIVKPTVISAFGTISKKK